MYFESGRGVGISDELQQYAKLEGVEAVRLSNAYVQANNGEQPDARDGVLDSLKLVHKGAEVLSKPLDLLATSSTDISIAVLENVVRKIDPFGKKIPIFPWEELWISRRVDLLENKERPNLSGIHQNEAIVEWLMDGIFPLEAVDEADKLYPDGLHGVGFRSSWLPHLRVVAEEQKYAWSRTFVESVIDGTLTGLITALPAEQQSEAGLFKLVGLLMTTSMSTKTTQKYNYLWGVKSDLAIDLRTVVGRYGSRSSKIKTNFDTAVNDILMGSMNELNQRLSTLGIWTMLGSMSLSAAVFRLPKRGPMAVVDGLIYAGLGASAIKSVESGKVRGMLEGMSGLFGETLKDINVQAEDHESVAQLSHELVGSRAGVRDLAEKRNLITFLKNVPTSLFVEILPLMATSAASLLAGDSFTSAVFSVGQVTRNAVGRMGTFMSYKSGQANRIRARENLVSDLKSLRTSVYGQLTNEALNGWLSDEVVNLEELPHELNFVQVGMPHFSRASDGMSIDLVRFETPFVVKKGDIVPIIGENGSGKTMLMKVLAGEITGILENTAITWGGVDLRSVHADQRRRSWKVVTSNENDSLRDLLASALLYKGGLRRHNLAIVIDKDRLLQWAKGKQEYPELERVVSDQLRKWTIKIHASEVWYKLGLRPSGMQRAMANLAFHCFLDEPVNLLIDEAGGELDSKRIDEYIKLIQERSVADELPGAVFVAINKDVGKWMMATQSAYIDMRDVIQGHIKNDGVGGVEFSEQVGMDMAREYQTLYELGKPMTPEQFIIWITYGPGREFDMQALEIKALYTNGQKDDLHDNFPHIAWIRESGVMEFESGPYAQYLKLCLTSWFEKIYTFRHSGYIGNMSEAIDRHLAKVLESLHVFYGRDLRVGEERVYFRNMNGSVIDSPTGRWSPSLHERLFGKILQDYLVSHARTLGIAMGFFDHEHPGEFKQYPTSYEQRYNLLEKAIMINDLYAFVGAYYKNGSFARPFGDAPETIFNVGDICRERRHFIEKKLVPDLNHLTDLIVSDPVVLYDLAHTGNSHVLGVFREYFSIVLNKLDKKTVESIRDRLIQIELPTKHNGMTVYRSFWYLVNANVAEGIEVGWLKTLFDKRLASLLS